MAMNFLTDAARLRRRRGRPPPLLPGLGLPLDTPLQQVRAADIAGAGVDATRRS